MNNFWDGKCFPCIIWIAAITIVILTIGSVKQNKKTKIKHNDTQKISKNIRSNNRR